MPLIASPPRRPTKPRSERSRRVPALIAATIAAVLALGGVLIARSPQGTGEAEAAKGTAGASASTASSPTTAAPTATASSAAPTITLQNSASGLPFMLGAGGDGVDSGTYSAALGRQLDLVTTWADDGGAQATLPALAPGGDLAGWKGSLDIAIGAFDSGGTWAQAAQGADDARWSRTLRLLATYRAGASGTTYIRFAHEMNGDWYPWSVTSDQTQDFVTAWKRFRALQVQLFPAAKLVFCANQNSVGYEGNWESLYPGAGQVDLMSVDKYNNYPHITTDSEFDQHLDDVDSYGGPVGLDTHLAFASSVGLPMAISEWSPALTTATDDNSAFVRGMWSYLNTHAGAGPGQVPYAAQFNVSEGHQGQFNLLVGSKMPDSSATYRSLFGPRPVASASPTATS